MKNKHLFLIVFFISLAVSLSAQSFFKPVPKVEKTFSTEFEKAIAPTTMNAWRPIANVAAYSLPGNVLYTGAGIAFSHLVYNSGTTKWDCTYSISGLLYAGTTLGSTATATVSPGISVGFLNNLIMIGAAYDKNKVVALVGLGISLNN